MPTSNKPKLKHIKKSDEVSNRPKKYTFKVIVVSDDKVTVKDIKDALIDGKLGDKGDIRVREILGQINETIKPLSEKPLGNVEVDLSGENGNAFVLMGYARQWAKQLEYSKDDIDKLLKDMQSDDYEHLLEVLEEHFGDYVTFYR